MQRTSGLITSILGFIGLLASFSLVLERLAAYEDPKHVASCDINPLFSCTTITQTWQASLFGFPNPLIGVIAFTIAVILGALVASGVSLPRWVNLAFLCGITLGLVFIFWLIYQAVFVIGLLCLYCMVVWSVTIVLFFQSLKTNILEGHMLPRKSRDARERVAGWCWVSAAGVFIAVASVVIFGLFL